MVSIGILGCGRWGANHLRVFASLPDVRVVAAVDTQPQRIEAWRRAFPGLSLSTNPESVIDNPDIDAVVISTPAVTHFDLTSACLEREKDVLCEKPLAVLPAECRELARLAERRRRVLMVGHVYLFHPAVDQLRRYIRENHLGRILYAFSVRANQGPVRDDVDVVYDLASHDLSIFNYLLDAQPTLHGAQGITVTDRPHTDAAFLAVRYPGGVLANIHVSWTAAHKTRSLTIVGEQRAIEWNELEATGPLRIFEKGRHGKAYYKSFGEFQLLSHEIEIFMPAVPAIEPLETQARHFLDCIRQRAQPLANANRAAEIVELLHEASAMLHRAGGDR